MNNDYNVVVHAKRHVKAHIKFFEDILKHLKGTDKTLRNRAVWAAWCLNEYIEKNLIADITEAIRIQEEEKQKK